MISFKYLLLLLVLCGAQCLDQVLLHKKGELPVYSPQNSSAPQRQAEGTYLEKPLKSLRKAYLVTLEVPDQLRVYEVVGNQKKLIFGFDASQDVNYEVASAAAYLVVGDIDQDGNEEVAWKFCKGHFCPFQNGAIVYHVAKRELFRLDYAEETGIALSHNLQNPENRKVKEWLIHWWHEWPGSSVRLDKVQISYR